MGMSFLFNLIRTSVGQDINKYSSSFFPKGINSGYYEVNKN